MRAPDPETPRLRFKSLLFLRHRLVALIRGRLPREQVRCDQHGEDEAHLLHFIVLSISTIFILSTKTPQMSLS